MISRRLPSIMATFALVGLFMSGSYTNAQQPPMPTAAPYYLPSHPYPNPEDPAFREPGDTIRYYLGGKTVDDITDTTNYFRTGQYKLDLDAALGAKLDAPGTNIPFDVAKQQVMTAMDEKIQNIEDKRTQLLNEASTNDNIGLDIDDVKKSPNPQTSTLASSKDKQIKDAVSAFIQKQIDVLNRDSDANLANGEDGGFKALVANATTLAQLQTYSDQMSARHDAEEQEGRTLAARIMGQRILHFSWNVQELYKYFECLIPQYAASGYDISRHQKYLINQGSLKASVPNGDDPYSFVSYVLAGYQDSIAKIVWYLQSPITTATAGVEGTVPYYPYRANTVDEAFNVEINNWLNGGRGARSEYEDAAHLLETAGAGGACVGAPWTNCREQVVEHMRNGKRHLQDLFHLAYWGWDDFQCQQQACNPTNSCNNTSIWPCNSNIKPVNSSACTFPPSIHWGGLNGTPPAFSSTAPFPTTESVMPTAKPTRARGK